MVDFTGKICDFCMGGVYYTSEVRCGYYQETQVPPKYVRALHSHTIVLDGKRIRLDLCDEHERDFQRVCYLWEVRGTVIDQVEYTLKYAKVEILDERTEPPKKVGKLVCPKCGFKGRTIGGLNNHKTRQGHR